jgi:outer membrane protein OmpA-like peptidoglycan-associated protein
MSTEQPARPTLLANLILMFIVGGALVVFFVFIKGCGKKAVQQPVAKEEPAKVPATTEKTATTAKTASADKKPATPEKKAEPAKTSLSPEEQSKALAKANEVRPKSGPVAADPAEQERTRQMLLDTGPRKPFTEVPKEFQQPTPPAPTPATPNGQVATATPPSMPATPNGQIPSAPPPQSVPGTPASADAPPSTPEPVREVETASPEGAALLADATARIDEAPPEMYSDKAKAKVREGLKSARRIFKVHTVYFEKGGAVTQEKDFTQLTKALEAQNMQDAMADPRSVFFVLGFADKTGAADTNKKLSVARADAVIALLRDKCGVLNFTYPVAVGSTELVAPANKEKNRAAEVWLVLP